MNNAHKILGVSETSNKSEIKKAYHKMCLIYHPDVGGDVNNFLKIKEAYDYLVVNNFNPNITHNFYTEKQSRYSEYVIFKSVKYNKALVEVTYDLDLSNISAAYVLHNATFYHYWQLKGLTRGFLVVSTSFLRKTNFSYTLIFVTSTGKIIKKNFSFKDPRSKFRKFWDSMFN